jgi:putative glutamine amidotransferase
MPIVGICHGCQVINRHFGGTIVPVPEDRRLVHKDAARFALTGERAEHEVTVKPGPSLMADFFGEGRLRVNSSHTQRCGALAPGFRVTASAEDGVIESIEHERLPIFGFQFHPEVYWQKDSRFLELIRRAFHRKKAE